MKILQLNIWGGKLGRNVSNFLKREAADIICLQEVISIPGGESFFFEDLEEIQKNTGYQHAYFTPSHEFSLMKRRAMWGLAILSNQEFLKKESLYTYLNKTDDFDFLENTDYNTGRVLQHTVLKNDSGLLNVLNHHGHHLGSHKNGDAETLRQCELIAEYIKSLEGKVVLCGDFNLVPDSPSLNLINNILVNHIKDHNIASTRTTLTHKTEVCDYIFTSSDVKVSNVTVLDDIVSDHKAITLTF